MRHVCNSVQIAKGERRNELISILMELAGIAVIKIDLNHLNTLCGFHWNRKTEEQKET